MMKTKIFLIHLTFFLFISGSLFAQSSINIKIKATKSASSIKKDKEFVVDSVSFNPRYLSRSLVGSSSKLLSTYIISTTQGGKSGQLVAIELPRGMDFLPVMEDLSDYWFAKNLSSLKTISEIEDLYSTRAEMEDEANRYLSTLSNYGLIYDDPYLESYLYSIVAKILPAYRADGFSNDLKVVIVRDETMNACVFPNGMMIINTGLLAAMHTEDELVAALAHEIGHFVANHSLVNKRKMEKEAAKAEFWAAFATGAAAIVEGYAASQGSYLYGSLTMSTAVLSAAVAYDALKRIGLDFSSEQEKEADIMAINALNYLGYDKNAAATLFQRMTDAYNAEGNWAAYYLTGNHPSLERRIEYSGIPYKKTDPEFEKKVSFAVTEAAISKYNQGRFRQAMEYVTQNIDNYVATDDDYLLKALCTLNLYNDAEHNKGALSFIQRAKEMNPENANILRTEIIASLRCNNNAGARSLLDTYLKNLSEGMANISDKDSSVYRTYVSEYEWARKMAIKVNGL